MAIQRLGLLVCISNEYHFLYKLCYSLCIVILRSGFCFASVPMSAYQLVIVFSINIYMYIGIYCIFCNSMLFYLEVWSPSSSVVSYCNLFLISSKRHQWRFYSFNPRCGNDWSIIDHSQLWLINMVTITLPLSPKTWTWRLSGNLLSVKFLCLMCATCTYILGNMYYGNHLYMYIRCFLIVQYGVLMFHFLKVLRKYGVPTTLHTWYKLFSLPISIEA